MVKSRRRASCSGEPNVLSSVIRKSSSLHPSRGPLRLAAERRHFDDHVLKDDVHQAEAAADDAAVAEEAADLARMRVRGDVEVLRLPAHQQIAHAAAAQVRAVAAAMQPVEDLEDVFGYAPARDRMLAAVDDCRVPSTGLRGLRSGVEKGLSVVSESCSRPTPDSHFCRSLMGRALNPLRSVLHYGSGNCCRRS
jgi:hypothetical protein